MKIKSIKKIDYDGDVYNLHVKDNHNYFASDHCVSNCHEFDSVFSDFISISITETIVKRLCFTNEYEIVKRLNKIVTIDDYVKFLVYLVGEINDTIESLSGTVGSSNSKYKKAMKADLKINNILGTKNKEVRMMQVIADLETYLLKIDIFMREYKESPENWVLESNYNLKTKSRDLSLEPIWAYNYLNKYVWSRYDHVILMSGTILDRELFCYLNGLDKSDTVYYSIDSPFAISNRPIYYMPVARLTYKNKVDSFQLMVPYIEKILKKYKNHKGIIHTVSFEFANWIVDNIKDKRLIFHDSTNKNDALRRHLDSDEPTVLISPSMGTGVSFDNDKSRFQILLKVPYPSLGSQKNKMRQHINPDWYSWRTVSSFIQMTGRSVRSGLDYADTFIIDACFSDIMKYSSHFIPGYIQKAIKRINVK